MLVKRGRKRTPDVVRTVRGLKTWCHGLSHLCRGLIRRGGNKQVLKRQESASLCTVTSDITSLVKAYFGYRGLHVTKLVSVSVE